MECEHTETHLEEDFVYFPTQQQIDTNTDHDEIVHNTVCDDCGEILDAAV